MNRHLFGFALYSGLLLLKKRFYAFFLTAMYFAFIPLAQIKRLGAGGIYNFPSKTLHLFGAWR